MEIDGVMGLPGQGYGTGLPDGPSYGETDTGEPMDGCTEENMPEAPDDSTEEGLEEPTDEDTETGTGDAVGEGTDMDTSDVPDSPEGTDTESTDEGTAEESAEDSGTNEREGIPEDAVGTAGADISGNSIITVSGNALIFPEDFDLSLLNGSDTGTTSETEATEAIKAQTEFMFVASAVIIFLLGTLVGVTLIHGIRLRRV